MPGAHIYFADRNTIVLIFAFDYDDDEQFYSFARLSIAKLEVEIFFKYGEEKHARSIARAIVNGPKILICDEPTGNLDPKTSMEIMEVLEAINELGTTIIMVTHDISIVKKMKKRVVLLDSGRVVRDYKEGEYK